MEDEGFIDDDLIEDVAREYVGRFGLSSIALLTERAEIAEAAGDYLNAQAWRDIAAVAQRILSI